MVNRETRGMWTQGRDDVHSFDRSNINARYVNARPSSLKASLSLSLLFFEYRSYAAHRKEIGSFERSIRILALE